MAVLLLAPSTGKGNSSVPSTGMRGCRSKGVAQVGQGQVKLVGEVVGDPMIGWYV